MSGSIQHRFSIVPARAASDKNLTENALRILLALGSLGNRAGYCWPSYMNLATMTGLTERQIGPAIQLLIELAWVERSIAYTSAHEIIEVLRVMERPDAEQTILIIAEECPPYDATMSDRIAAANKYEDMATIKASILFDEFWAQYPRKVDKDEAFRAWRIMIGGSVSLAIEAVRGVSAYKNYVKSNKIENRFIKLPANYLWQRAWMEAWDEKQHAVPAHVERMIGELKRDSQRQSTGRTRSSNRPGDAAGGTGSPGDES